MRALILSLLLAGCTEQLPCPPPVVAEGVDSRQLRLAEISCAFQHLCLAKVGPTTKVCKEKP